MKKTLVIALDGMDLELIEEFGLENIKQEEFGQIDNQTGMSETFTSELFASFITGKTNQHHGIKGLTKWSNEKVGRMEDAIDKLPLSNKTESLRKAIIESINSLQAKQSKYSKEDLECDTIFEEVDNSRAMFVPSYNPSVFWVIGAGLEPVGYGYSLDETVNHYDTREFRHRKEQLFKELENDITGARDFLMCHFHRPDIYHHLYGDKEVGAFDEDKLYQLYQELDEFADRVIEKAKEAGYERIIFMSDHGLPTKEGHNKNAFYSSSDELFGEQKPRITDFHSKLTR